MVVEDSDDIMDSKVEEKSEEKEKTVETQEVINKVVETPVIKALGVPVMPIRPSSFTQDTQQQPSWMEEFSRKKANRKSGIYSEKQDTTAAAGVDDGKVKTEKPALPRSDSKPNIAVKPDSDLRRSFSREKSLSSVAKQESSKTEAKEEKVEKRGESGKEERHTRPALPASLVSNISSALDVKKTTDIVKHSSDLPTPAAASKTTPERKPSDLTRKHSDSSRHSDKLSDKLSDKPTVHSTNLGNPDKFSFAKPERPVMDKVTSSKNSRNSSSASDKQEVGWRQEITNNRSDSVLTCRENNGQLSSEKENMAGKCREVRILSVNLNFHLVCYCSCKI